MVTLPQTNTRFDRNCPSITLSPAQGFIPDGSNPFIIANAETNSLPITSKLEQSSLLTSGNEPSSLTLSKKQNEYLLQQLHTVDLLTAPNPAESQMGVRFRLPENATVTVELYDALQRVILAPLQSVTLTEGEHDYTLPVGTCSAGAYSLRVKAVLANGKLLFVQRPIMIVR